MYDADHRTSMGLMLTGKHVNNPRLNRERQSSPSIPKPGDRARQADRPGCATTSTPGRGITGRCPEHPDESPARARRRAASDDPWSVAAIGVDRHGRVLFIHCRSPYTPHDLVENLLSLPLDLAGAMYAEGGPEAQLYVRSGRREIELVGSHGTSLFGSDSAWPVPNVIGIVRRR